MNYHINKSKIFLKLDECGLTLDSLSKMTHLSKNYLNKMLSGKTKKLLPFITIAKELRLSLEDILIYK